MARARRWIFPVGVIALGLSAIGLLFLVITGPQNPNVPTSAELDRVLPVDPRPLPTGAFARLGFVRGNDLAGRKEVVSAAYSADGKVIVAADWTGAANVKGCQLWDAESGALVGEVPTPIGALFGVSLSKDGKRLAWGGNDGITVVGVSDVETRRVLMRSTGGNRVYFTSDDLHVVCGQHHGPLFVRNAVSGEITHTLTERGRVANSFVLSRDGSTVVASTERVPLRNYDFHDARVDVWDVATGRLRKVVATRPYNFGSRQVLAVSSDGKTVAYSDNKQLTVVELETGAERWRIENPGKYHVWEFVAFSPSNDVLLAIRTNHDSVPSTTMDLLDATTGLTVRTLDGEAGQFSEAAFSPDGRRILTYGQGVPVRVWDAATGQLLPAYDGHRVPPHLVAFGDHGDALVSADQSYSVCAWNIPSLRHRFDVRFAKSLGISGNGRTAIVTSHHHATLLLDLEEKTRRVLKPYRSEFSAISRDGRLAAVGVLNDIELIDTGSGEVRGKLTGHVGEPYALSFSGDGRRLLSATRTRIIRRPFGGPERGLPDDTIRVWDLTTGQELRKWERLAECAALSPQGKIMLAGCADGRIRRMKVETGEELEPLAGHAGAVVAVAVSADGRHAASAGSDGIILWDPVAGQERKRLTPDHGATTALAFSGDGRRLASAGADGTILVWDMASIE
jgi:WD40 repeat protein